MSFAWDVGEVRRNGRKVGEKGELPRGRGPAVVSKSQEKRENARIWLRLICVNPARGRGDGRQKRGRTQTAWTTETFLSVKPSEGGVQGKFGSREKGTKTSCTSSFLATSRPERVSGVLEMTQGQGSKHAFYLRKGLFSKGCSRHEQKENALKNVKVETPKGSKGKRSQKEF